MAKKTNCKVNGVDYYRLRAKTGEKEDGAPVYKNFYGTCKSDAEQKRDTYFKEQDRIAEEAAKAPEYTIGELARIWMYEVRRMDSRLKKTSYDRYERLYRAYFKEAPFAVLPVTTGKLGLEIQR